jgi:hypothetical protein
MFHSAWPRSKSSESSLQSAVKHKHAHSNSYHSRVACRSLDRPDTHERFADKTGARGDLSDIFFGPFNHWTVLYLPLPTIAVMGCLLGIAGVYRQLRIAPRDRPADDDSRRPGVLTNLVLALPFFMAVWIVIADDLRRLDSRRSCDKFDFRRSLLQRCVPADARVDVYLWIRTATIAASMTA